MRAVVSAPRESALPERAARAAGRAVSPAALLCLVAAATAAATMLASDAAVLSPDSITYLDMAAQWRSGAGLTHRWAYWDPVYESARLPTATSMWPPGYSMLIALGAELTGSLQRAARLVSAVAFGLLAIPLYLVARTALRAELALVVAVAAMCASPVMTCAAAVASESAFLLLFAAAWGCSLSALHARDARAARRWLLWAGAWAGASVWLRYVGLGAIAGVMLAAALRARRASPRDAAGFLGSGGVPAVVLAGAVFLRERWVSGGLPLSWPGGGIFWSTLGDAAKGIVAELTSSPAALGLPLWLTVVFLQAGALLALATIASRRRKGRARDPAHDSPVGPLLAATTAFLVPYLAVTLAARCASGMNVEPRFVTILTPILAAVLFAAALRGAAIGTPRASAALAAIALLVASQLFISATRRNDSEESYIARARGAPWLAWLEPRTSAEEPLLATRGAELAAGLPNPVLRLPRLPYSRHSAVSWTEVDDLASRAGARVLVHSVGQRGVGRFDPAAQRWLESLDRPDSHPGRVLAAFPDCVIYRVGGEPARHARAEQ